MVKTYLRIRKEESRSVREGCDQCPPFMDERPPPEPSSSFSLFICSLLSYLSLPLAFVPLFRRTHISCIPFFRTLLSCTLSPFSLSSFSHIDTCIRTYTRTHTYMHEFVDSLSRTFCLSFTDAKTERVKRAHFAFARRVSLRLTF